MFATSSFKPTVFHSGTCSDAAYVGQGVFALGDANEVLTLIEDYDLCLCTVVEARYDTSWQSQEYRHLQNLQTDII